MSSSSAKHLRLCYLASEPFTVTRTADRQLFNSNNLISNTLRPSCKHSAYENNIKPIPTQITLFESLPFQVQAKIYTCFLSCTMYTPATSDRSDGHDTIYLLLGFSWPHLCGRLGRTLTDDVLLSLFANTSRRPFEPANHPGGTSRTRLRLLRTRHGQARLQPA